MIENNKKYYAGCEHFSTLEEAIDASGREIARRPQLQEIKIYKLVGAVQAQVSTEFVQSDDWGNA